MHAAQLSAQATDGLLTTQSTTIYVGTEARHLEPIAMFAADRKVDIAVLPIDDLVRLAQHTQTSP